jgi:arsenate reductase
MLSGRWQAAARARGVIQTSHESETAARTGTAGRAEKQEDGFDPTQIEGHLPAQSLYCHASARLGRQNSAHNENISNGASRVTRKYKVLFLCLENSARSIIAEALLRELAGHRFEVFSAGSEPAARVHSLAIAQLRPGISELAVLAPKSWLEFTGEWAPRMDLIVALDERVAEYHAPEFPGKPLFVDWEFADPLAPGMTPEERARSFEKVFWQIVRRVTLFMELPRYTLPEPPEVPELPARVEVPGAHTDPAPTHGEDVACPG